MKQIYMKTLMFVGLMLAGFAQAQTYTINSSGWLKCNWNSGIAESMAALFSGTLNLGSFTDTNSSEVELTSLSISVYHLSNGTVEVFLNNVSVGTVSSNHPFASCSTSAENAKKTVSFTLTPAIKSAYNLGQSNTISVSRISGDRTYHYFYGAEVVVSTKALGVGDSEYAGVEVFPNPAREFITVTGLKSAKRYNVYNVLGAKVLSGEVSNRQTIDVRNLQKGLYFLRFPDGGGVEIKFLK